MNARASRSAAAILLMAALVACSGTNGGSLLGAASQSAASPEHASKRKIEAKIRITIPKRKGHRRLKVRGHYISPATQSIAIAVTPASGPVTYANANLTPATNGNCTASLISPLICTVTLTLPVGSYTIAISTWDGLLSGAGGPSDAPTGSELSANQDAPLVVASGQANQVSITLGGIPVAVALVPAANSTLSGNMANGFTAAKCGPAGGNGEKVSVFGVDADGNYILGSGAPVPSLTSNSSLFATPASPSPLSPNTFTLVHTISASAQGPGSLTFAATPASDSGGATQTASTNVSIAAGTQICGIVSEYTLPTAHANPEGIVAGPDGNLWFTEYAAGQVGKITTGGSVTEHATGFSGTPYDITVDHNNVLWFTDLAGGIDSVTTSFVFNEFTSGLSGTGPKGVTVDASDAIWFTECHANEIANFSGGVISEFTAASVLGDNPSPSGITLGPGGNFWFARQDGAVSQATPGGALTKYDVSGVPQWITTAAGGDMWFSESPGGMIGRITTAGAITEYPVPGNRNPFDITPGPDGNVWFTEQTSSKVGSITTGGVITEFDVPSSSDIEFIAAGPDGAMWFTDASGDKIGRIQ